MRYFDKISQGEITAFAPIPDGSEAIILKDLAESSDKGVVHLCKNDVYAERICEILEFIAPEIETIFIPAWDFNPYDNTSPSTKIASKRLHGFARIANGLRKNKILITTANAAITKNLPKDIIAKSTFKIEKNTEIKRDEITNFLVENSYINVGAASDSGEFSIRGSIIDIYPPAQDFGIRVDFFGNEVESIRKYDPLTQISSGELSQFTFVDRVIEMRLEQIDDAYSNRNVFIKSGKYDGVETNLLNPDSLYLNAEGFKKILSNNTVVGFNKFDNSNTFKSGFTNVRNYYLDGKIEKKTAITLLQEDLSEKIVAGKGKDKTKTLICCMSEVDKRSRFAWRKSLS